MSISKEIWGPATWNVMYAFSHALPDVLDEEKKQIINLFTSIMMLLPCNECKSHFKGYMERKPIEEHVGTREEILKWVGDLHNEVKAMSDKSPLKTLIEPKSSIPHTSFSIQKKKSMVIPKRPCNCGKKNLNNRVYK